MGVWRWIAESARAAFVDDSAHIQAKASGAPVNGSRAKVKVGPVCSVHGRAPIGAGAVVVGRCERGVMRCV